MKKRIRRVLTSVVLIVALLAPAASVYAEGEILGAPPIETVKVDFTSQLSGRFLHAPQFDYEVSSVLAEQYGYVDKVDGVSALDVLVAAHELVFEDEFTKQTAKEYLLLDGDTVERQFGVDYEHVDTFSGEPSYSHIFMVNHAFPNDGTKNASGIYNGIKVTEQKVENGDLIEFFFNENGFYMDTYNWFLDEDGKYSRTFQMHVGEEKTLLLNGIWIPDPLQHTGTEMEAVEFRRLADEIDGAQIYAVDLETGELTELDGALTDYGKVSICFDEPGSYAITAYADLSDEWEETLVMSLTTIEVGDHTWELKDETKATFDAPGSKTYTCKECGEEKAEELSPLGFEIKADGTVIGQENIEIIDDGFDASYDFGTPETKVEAIIPLAVVTLPDCKTEEIEITLNDHAAKYQNYYYTKEAGSSGYTEYIDYGFGDQIDQWNKIAEANKAYKTKVPPADQVIRVQTAYDANWNSENLYAIAFELPHEMEKVAEKAATCTADGNKAHWKCKACGKLYADEDGEEEIAEADVKIEKLGHDFDEGKVTKQPTRTAEGVRTYTCKRCGETKTEPVAKLGAAAVYRLYNPNSGEHFFTTSVTEKNHLAKLGWADEGIGWYAPKSSKTAVYRVYNPNAGDHHYTISKAERDMLVELGWNDEGIAWYSDDAKGAPLYRLYNPNAQSGAHHFTISAAEQKAVKDAGWTDEGIGWYSLA